ncbi:MAG: metallophosphoesterase [Dehalococcoidia bacterium]
MKRTAITATFATAVLTTGCAALIEARRPRLTRRDVELSTLPPSLEGMTILHLSDLHVSGNNGVLSRFLSRLSDVEADLVVITGDLVDSEAGIEPCTEMLGALRGRYGVYSVMGNHDHFTYPVWSVLLGIFRYHRLLPTRRIVESLESRGIRVLNNESLRLEIGDEVVHLAGIDDIFCRADDLPKAVENIGEDGLKVLLCHSPDVLDDATALGFDLVLAGHTHGGQVRLPFVGALTTHTLKPLRPASGIIRRNTTTMHVSQGLGTTGLPIRFLCPPEATLLRLVRI